MAADLELYAAPGSTRTRRSVPVPAGTADALSNGAGAPVTIAPGATVLRRDAEEVFVIVRCGLGAA